MTSSLRVIVSKLGFNTVVEPPTVPNNEGIGIKLQYEVRSHWSERMLLCSVWFVISPYANTYGKRKRFQMVLIILFI